jgi:hypothetical protein
MKFETITYCLKLDDQKWTKHNLSGSYLEYLIEDLELSLKRGYDDYPDNHLINCLKALHKHIVKIGGI